MSKKGSRNSHNRTPSSPPSIAQHTQTHQASPISASPAITQDNTAQVRADIVLASDCHGDPATKTTETYSISRSSSNFLLSLGIRTTSLSLCCGRNVRVSRVSPSACKSPLRQSVSEANEEQGGRGETGMGTDKRILRGHHPPPVSAFSNAGSSNRGQDLWNEAIFSDL